MPPVTGGAMTQPVRSVCYVAKYNGNITGGISERVFFLLSFSQISSNPIPQTEHI